MGMFDLMQLGGGLIQKGGEIIPQRSAQAANAMRNVTPRPAQALRLGTSGGSSLATGLAPSVAKTLANRFLVLKALYDTGDLALNEDARERAVQNVEESAMNDGAATRALKGFLDPVKTGYGIGAMVGDLVQSTAGALKSEKQLNSPREITPEMVEKREKVKADREAFLAAEAAAANQQQSFQDATESRLAKLDGRGEYEYPETIEEVMAPVETDSGEGFDADGSLKQGLDALASQQEQPKAKPVIDPTTVEKLFQVTHGTPYDPKSRMDKRKRIEIESALEEMGGLGKMTPNQFALQMYRRS
jgi:hypothetical protein